MITLLILSRLVKHSSLSGRIREYNQPNGPKMTDPTLTNEWMTDVERWKTTKTPKKRAQAVRRHLAFLSALYHLTKARWARVGMKELAAHYRISPSVTFLCQRGKLERKGRKYRWCGSEPSKRLAEDCCDYRMAYSRRVKNRCAVVKEEHQSTFAALHTADKRADKYEAILQWCYNRLHKGYRNISLTDVFQKRKVPHQAICHLREKGLLDRPRLGTYKWIGPPPDRELALWLYGMLAEHHRSIYRSKMDKKKDRTAMIDELTGRASSTHHEPASAPHPTAAQVKPSSKCPVYWSPPTTSW